MNIPLRLFARGPFAAITLGLIAGQLRAQTPPAASPSKDEVVTLSPFTVTTDKDKGYYASNTISGTRLNTAIKDLPMPIEVITSEFIRDIGAKDLKELLAFSSGIYGGDNFTQDSGGPGLFDFSPSRPTNKPLSLLPSAVNIRGFYTGTQLRLGFRDGTQYDATVLASPSDTAEVDRAEVVRGPAALLYGVSTLGGVVNILPKMPIDKPGYEIDTSYGSFGLRRASVDATGPILLGNKLNYRLVAAHSESGSEVDFYKLKSDFVTFKLDFRPLQNTKIYTDLRYQKTKENGFGFSGGARDVFDSDDATIARNRYFELFNWTRDGGGKSRRTFNLAGPDTHEDTKNFAAMIQLEQKILENLTFIAGVQYSHADIQELRIFNRGTVSVTTADQAQIPDPAIRTTYANGIVKAVRYDWDNDPWDVKSRQYRLELNYQLKTGTISHNFLLGRQSTRDEVFRPNNDPTRQNNSTNGGFQLSEFRSVTDYAPIRYDGTTFVRTRDTTQWNWFDGDYFVYQGKALNERLHAILGARHDRFASRVLDFDYVGGVRNTAPTFPDEGPGTARPFNAPKRNGYRFGGDAQTENTFTGGLNYAVTKEVSAYALVAQGLFPNPGQRDGAAQNFTAEKTLSKEIGLKVDLLGGKISGTISGFEIERQNATYFYSNAPAPRNNYAPQIAPGQNLTNFDPSRPRFFAVRQQYFPTGYAGSTTNDVGQAVGTGYFLVNYETLASHPAEKAALEAAFADTSTAAPIDYGATASNTANKGRGSDSSYKEKARGIDTQLIFSPLPNWQVTFNYAYINKEVSEGFALVDAVDLNNGKNYGTEYDAWLLELGRANFSDPTRASTWNRQSIVGKSLDLGPKHTASMYSNYMFTKGALKGLSLRGGVIYTGTRPSSVDFGGGNTNINLLRTPDVDPRFDVRLGAGYRLKLSNYNWRFNLSVDNALDKQKDETTVTYSLANGSTTDRRQISFYKPRSYRLSASLEF